MLISPGREKEWIEITALAAKPNVPLRDSDTNTQI